MIREMEEGEHCRWGWRGPALVDQSGTWERSLGSEDSRVWAGLFLVGPP